MKISLVKASAKSDFKTYKQEMGAPPQNIFSVAAATPPGVEVELVDETVNMKVNFRTKSELIGIFMSTPDAPRAYNLAQKFKKKGKTVVFGGLHPTFLPDEALQYGDAVVIGEAEGVWEQLLNDYQAGQLQTRYERTEPVDLAQLQPYPVNKAFLKKYAGIWSVMVSRGCRFRCTYCLVHPFFKQTLRYRPIEHVVEEIRQSGAQWVELHADNLIANREYAKALFKALKPLNTTLIGEADIQLAKDEELLELAAESGLKYLLIGLETPSQSALKSVGKGFIPIDKIQAYIQKFHDYEFYVDSSFLFGFDVHESTIFEETYNFAKEIDLDEYHSVILIPFPGSRIFEQFESEGRILTKDWSKYDGSHAVFQPKHMTPRELEEGAWWFHQKTRSLNKNAWWSW